MPVYLSFDFGRRRIGAAVGDTVTGTARPLPTLLVGDPLDWKPIVQCVTDWRPEALIVGLPLNEDGSDQAITTAARRFAAELARRTGLEIHLADERYSSRAADDLLREARASGRMNRRVRKGDRDGEAARVVLEQWMTGRSEIQ